MNEAFITGSRAYGIPRENSDIDLAVVVTEQEARILRNLSDSPRKTVYGRLNLVLFVNTEDGLKRYEAWKRVNDALKLVAPVTKETAISALDKAGAQNPSHADSGEYGGY